MSAPAVVLLSGGLDSATVAAIARRDGFAVHAQQELPALGDQFSLIPGHLEPIGAGRFAGGEASAVTNYRESCASTAGICGRR